MEKTQKGNNSINDDELPTKAYIVCYKIDGSYYIPFKQKEDEEGGTGYLMFGQNRDGAIDAEANNLHEAGAYLLDKLGPVEGISAVIEMHEAYAEMEPRVIEFDFSNGGSIKTIVPDFKTTHSFFMGGNLRFSALKIDPMRHKGERAVCLEEILERTAEIAAESLKDVLGLHKSVSKLLNAAKGVEEYVKAGNMEDVSENLVKVSTDLKKAKRNFNAIMDQYLASPSVITGNRTVH